MSSNAVKKFYLDVVEHLFEQSRTFWDEEGLDESSMGDLRQLWESKLSESGIDLNKDLVGSVDEGRATNSSKSLRTAGGNRAKAAPAVSSSPSMAPSTSKTPSYPQSHQLAPPHSQPQYVQQSPHSNQQHHLMTSQSHQNPGMSLNQSAFSNVTHNQNGEISGGSVRLIPFNVPISGPIVHVPSQGVPTAPGFHRQSLSSQPPHPSQQPPMPMPMVSTVELQRFLTQERSGHIQAMDRLSQHGLSGNDQRSWSERPSLSHNMQHSLTTQQVAALQAHAIKSHGRPMNASSTGHQNQSFAISQNNNAFSSSSQVAFHQVGATGSGHPSVIHVMDRSGNQSALPVINSAGLPVENMGNPNSSSKQSGPNNIRKPNQPLTVQLDGIDDDNFEDLSDDDDTNIRSVGNAPKKLKTSKTTSERLEESDLDSGDDDDDEPGNVEMVDNVVVCQYEKISRTRNKWKFHLKSGMCSLNGKEFVFHKAVGDAEF